MSVRKTIFDTAAMSSVSVARMLAQFLAIPVLARYLSPDDYGIVGMAMPVVFFSMMFADAGIGMSLVRTDLNQRQEWSTCFWLSVILGVVLTAIMFCFAPLAAAVFDEPRLQLIVMALVSVVFIQAICNVPGAALQREQKFKLIAILEVIATVLSIAVAVVFAVNGYGAWALVFQQLAFYGIRLLLTFWFSGFRPKFFFDLHCVGEHLIFSRDVLSTNLVTFFTRSIDNLIIGKVLGPAPVGLYSMAFQFARLPFTLVTGPLQFVFYAKLSKVKENTPLIRTTFLALTRILMSLIFPSMGLIAAAHHPVFTLLLTEKWVTAGTMFMLVAPACAIQASTTLCTVIMLVLGRTDIQLRFAVESGVIWLTMLCTSVWFGIEWAAIAYNIAVIIYTPRLLMVTLPLIDCPVSAYLRAVMVPVTVTFGCIVMFLGLQHVMEFGDWAQLFLAGFFVLLGVVLCALIQRRTLMKAFATW